MQYSTRREMPFKHSRICMSIPIENRYLIDINSEIEGHFWLVLDPVYTVPVQLLIRSRFCYGSDFYLHCSELSVALLAPPIWYSFCTAAVEALSIRNNFCYKSEVALVQCKRGPNRYLYVKYLQQFFTIY